MTKQYGLSKSPLTTCSTSIPAHDLRIRAKELVSQIEPYVWELSQVLYKIKTDQLYMLGEVTYASFDDYVEGELHYSARRARYHVSIYDKFNQAKIEGEVVNQLGSSKSRLLARVVNEENKDVWLERAKHTTYKELDNIIRSEQQGKVIQGHSMGSINIPYRNGDTRIAWLEICELVARITGCESKEVVLEALMAEFASTYADSGTHDQYEQSKQIEEYEILSKAGWKCQIEECQRRVSLNVHHIIFRSQAPGLKDEASNKLVLCTSCHSKIHLKKADLVSIKGKWALKMR